MGKWPGKYVIGLTGNIATGKSVVRRMLEHLGAYGIDADALSHRAIARGAPGYKPVVETFGRWILDANQQIDRGRLGKVVFSDPLALDMLEAIVHPLVVQAVDLIIRRSRQQVVVIEAIKLLESSLCENLDSVWVTYAPQNVQVARLVKHRKMSEADARLRIQAQPPQEQKIAAARVAIKNSGSYEDTWKQVARGWQEIFPESREPAPAPAPAKPARRTGALHLAEPPAAPEKAPFDRKQLSVTRGGPRHSAEIAAFYSRLSANGQITTREDIMAAFGEKAFMLLHAQERLMGVVGWQVENLVARTTDLLLDPDLPVKDALEVLMAEVERASKDLQCEACLVFIRPDLAGQASPWKSLGYEERTPLALGVQAWQEAAAETMPPNTILLFKQLRVDRVLRPI